MGNQKEYFLESPLKIYDKSLYLLRVASVLGPIVRDGSVG